MINVKVIGAYGGVFAGSTALVGGSMVALGVGGAATLEAGGGAALMATVGLPTAIIALPIAAISGTIYLIGRS